MQQTCSSSISSIRATGMPLCITNVAVSTALCRRGRQPGRGEQQGPAHGGAVVPSRWLSSKTVNSPGSPSCLERCTPLLPLPQARQTAAVPPAAVSCGQVVGGRRYRSKAEQNVLLSLSINPCDDAYRALAAHLPTSLPTSPHLPWPLSRVPNLCDHTQRALAAHKQQMEAASDVWPSHPSSHLCDHTQRALAAHKQGSQVVASCRLAHAAPCAMQAGQAGADGQGTACCQVVRCCRTPSRHCRPVGHGLGTACLADHLSA